MFIKKQIKKVDVFEGLADEQVEGLDPIKKVKVEKKESEKALAANGPGVRETYKASYTLSQTNQATVHKEAAESRPVTNPVVETIQRLRAVNSFDDVKKGALPKKVAIVNQPIMMPSNVKFSGLIDYNPSLCKDYHDTGYCTFGDSCIYIHDRGDYKAGWEIEKEYQEELKRRRTKGDSNEDSEFKQKLAELEVQETCSVCNSELKCPVITLCDHIFCEKCIIKQKKCPDCKKETKGIFNNASKRLKEQAMKRDTFIQQYQAQNNQIYE